MEEKELYLLESPARRPFADGVNWLAQGISFCTQKFNKWLVVSLVFNLCAIGLGLISGVMSEMGNAFAIVGGLLNLVGNFIYIVLMAGFLVAMASFVENGTFSVNQLFTGFEKRKLGHLLILFSILMLCSIVLIVASALLFMTAVSGGGKEFLMLIAIAAIVIYVLLMCLGWLTLPLIMLHNVSATEAIKMSFSGSLKNILPMIAVAIMSVFIFGAVGFIILLIFSLSTQGNTWLISLAILLTVIIFLIMPVINAGVVYTAYRNIWTNLPIEKA